jgi:uncharacterized protein YceH (UPF0502 family)
VDLDPVEIRVVGSLAEKQLTTPQQYPLTLNALLLACNQTTNRDPVVSYDEALVEAALASLKERRLVRFVHPSHGRSAIRYRQVLDELLGLDVRQLALVAVLVLRGPQTAGELRARTERMAGFEGVADVEHELEQLATREDLVLRLPRRAGHKEDRFAHLLGGDPHALAGGVSGIGVSGGGGESAYLAGTESKRLPGLLPGSQPEAVTGSVAPADGVQEPRGLLTLASLQEQIDQLRERVNGLSSELAALRDDLGA